MSARAHDDSSSNLFPRGLSLFSRSLILIVFSLALLFLDQRSVLLKKARGYMTVAVYPLQVMVDLPKTALTWAENGVQSRSELLLVNQKLREQQLIQNAKLQKMASLQAENDRIRALLQSAERRHEEVLIAEILSVELDPYKHQIVVNKGSLHGVYEGQPLVDAWGVAGQITYVSRISSVATLITDSNHALPVEINRNGFRTILRGIGQADRLQLPYVSNSADVRPGDLLVTSGMGQRFPTGYPVAVITKVAQPAGAAFADVYARPTGHLERGREILLVWYHDPSATSPKEESASNPAAEVTEPKDPEVEDAE